MSEQWYYAKHGQRHGPVTAVELKGLATSGQLCPIDLVWKEGMTQWAEARRIKGLYPAPTSAQSPPLLPAAAPVIPAIPKAVPIPISARGVSQPIVPKTSVQPSKPGTPAPTHVPAAKVKAIGGSILGLLLVAFVVVRGFALIGTISSLHREGAKLTAFRALVAVYQSPPQGDVSIKQLNEHAERLKKAQDQFINIPFDFKKNPDEAKQIVELYMNAIEGNYDGELPSELRSHIEPMWYENLDDVKIPQRLREKYSESNR